MSHQIKKAYGASKNFYDNLITHATPWSKLYMKLFWGGTDDNQIAQIMLDDIPDDFAGRLLEVPVGTAVFTHEKWKKLVNADIICLDYSEDMLAMARDRLSNYSHISCIQGDVGDLPLEDNSCDIVLSMNGFHVFPDKARAYDEIYRVLKPGGRFVASFYIKGQSKITDCLVSQILARKGWFTPPFQTLADVKTGLEQRYHSINFHVDGSIVYFSCVKSSR